MAVARLLIQVEGGADIARAMGVVVGVTRSARAAMNADLRRSAVFELAVIGSVTRARLDALNLVRRAQERAVRAAMRGESEAAREITALRKRAAQLAAQGEVEQTSVHRTQSSRRIAQIREESRQRSRAANQALADARRLEQTIARGAGAVVGGVGRFASQAHGQVQGVRENAAESSRTLRQSLGSAAWKQGGTVSAGEFNNAQATVARAARRQGTTTAAMVAALSRGQGEGSVLEGDTEADRAANLRGAIETHGMATAYGIDPGQLLAARGRLAANGLSGAHLDRALSFITRGAHQGSVEVDQLITQGMPGITRLMGQRGAGLTGEAQQQALFDALRESVTTQEALGAQGMSARRVGNATAGLDRSLSSTRDVTRINHNLVAREAATRDPAERARIRAAREAMFERDPTQRGEVYRARAGIRGLQAAALLSRAYHGNVAAIDATLAGTGHGNAQGAVAPIRELIAALATAGAGGHTRAENIAELAGQEGYTPAQIAQARADTEGDALANLTREQEAGRQSLSDNTTALNQLSNRVADWLARNPLGASAASAAAPVAAVGLGAAGRGLLGAALPALASGAGAGLTAAGGAGLAAMGGTALLGAITGGGLGELASRGILAARGNDGANDVSAFSMNTVRGVMDWWNGADAAPGAMNAEQQAGYADLARRRAAGTAAGTENTAAGLGGGRMSVADVKQAMRDGIVQGMAGAKVMISPADAAHAARAADSGPQGAPGGPSVR